MSAWAAACALFVFALGAGPLVANAEPACSPAHVDLRGPFGQAKFQIDIADDPGEQARGLMHVAQMPSSKGMLFVYDRPMPLSFWMKNTLIPLDIIYADQHGIVTTIHENAIPGDLTPLPSYGPAQYVLEINGGLAKKLGISRGAQMRHPMISLANWHCE